MTAAMDLASVASSLADCARRGLYGLYDVWRTPDGDYDHGMRGQHVVVTAGTITEGARMGHLEIGPRDTRAHILDRLHRAFEDAEDDD